MFELTIKTDNPAVLLAIANAVKNTPPLGFQEGKPVEVNIHASLKDMKAAKEAVDLAPNTTVKEVVDEEPPTPPVTPTDPVAAEAYKVWREDIDAWRHHGNDFAYHYLGSPKIIYEIGEAFGKQMLQMLDKGAN